MCSNKKYSQFLIVASLCLVSIFISGVQAAPTNALVTNLPGFTDNFPSKHYAGYIDIDKKHLFYYFVQSERDPVKDPLVLWLNGGPGCSSLGGFVYEHGPFDFEVTENATQLHLNQYSWSKVSNILYLDSPVGVGLSYSENTSDYTTGDFQTASDTHTFLIKWFQEYPEFLGNSFYIAGESYAGIYIPTLASGIVKGNEAGKKPVINIKGYMIGNGATDPVFDENALVPFVHGMALISNDIYKAVESACNGSYHRPRSDACQQQIIKIFLVVRGVNLYNILEPWEYGDRDSEKKMGVRKMIHGRTWPFRAQVMEALLTSWPELFNGSGYNVNVTNANDDFATRWLNDEAVRKAIHVKPVKDSGEWVLCTNKLHYNQTAGSMLPYHKNLTSKGYRALIFSGDHDMAVPYTGSEAWTKSLGYKIVNEWRSWIVDHQVAGFTQGYANNLTFLTIKGAGHTVPEYKPKEALSFYSRWLEGKPI